MTVVVDTSILVDHLRGDARAVRLLQNGLNVERVVASVMTKVEVLAGVRLGEEAATAALLALIEWIPVDQPIADRAGELARQYLRSHPGVDSVDFVIAATAEQNGGRLWTRNRKHFPTLGSLPDPYGP